MSETKPRIPTEALSHSERLERIKGKRPLDILGKILEDIGRLDINIQQLEDLNRRFAGDAHPDYILLGDNGDYNHFTQDDLAKYKKEIGILISKLETFIEQAQAGTINPEDVEDWSLRISHMARNYRII